MNGSLTVYRSFPLVPCGDQFWSRLYWHSCDDFFTERLGWTFSDLVVPGYLVPIVVVAPWSAAIIIFEAWLTIVFVQF